MKKIFLVSSLFFCGVIGYSQDLSKFDLYKPGENAEEAINKAVKQAKAEGKNVFIQIGGNWCIWCMRFNDFVTADKQLDSAMHAGFVVYHLNYSKENFNKKLLERFEFPQRFGFPVFIVLNGEGKRIHTQNSEYLEQGKSYNKEKVLQFFDSWNTRALNPKQYENF